MVTLHRLETLSNRRRLTRAVRHILALAKKLGPIRFYMHPPTENALKRSGLIRDLETSTDIEIHGLEPYPLFIQSLMTSQFILTDGGSIQEEAYYLHKPCLILRNRTERTDGLGENAILATWDVDADIAFLRGLIGRSPKKSGAESSLHASRIILKALNEFRSRH
jgi:UDP-N-acetylglucosamine 2-epimerase (non-hydrolysing)